MLCVIKKHEMQAMAKLHRDRKWLPTAVFLPGESHGRRSLVSYSPRGRKESDTTERLHTHKTNDNRNLSLIYLELISGMASGINFQFPRAKGLKKCSKTRFKNISIPQNEST